MTGQSNEDNGCSYQNLAHKNAASLPQVTARRIIGWRQGKKLTCGETQLVDFTFLLLQSKSLVVFPSVVLEPAIDANDAFTSCVLGTVLRFEGNMDRTSQRWNTADIWTSSSEAKHSVFSVSNSPCVTPPHIIHTLFSVSLESCSVFHSATENPLLTLDNASVHCYQIKFCSQ